MARGSAAKGRASPRKTYTIIYERDGVEIERYVIDAFNEGDAENDAFHRFHKAHPEVPIIGKTPGLSKRIEVSDAHRT